MPVLLGSEKGWVGELASVRDLAQMEMRELALA